MIEMQIILMNVAILALCVAGIYMRKYMIAVNDNIRYRNNKSNPFLVRVTALGDGGAWIAGESTFPSGVVGCQEIDIHIYNLLERILKESYKTKVELDNEGFRIIKMMEK